MESFVLPNFSTHPEGLKFPRCMDVQGICTGHYEMIEEPDHHTKKNEP